MLVWYSMDDRIHSVSAERVDELRENPATPVAVAWNDQLSAEAAWNGRVFLTVWADARGYPRRDDVYVSRVAPSGKVLDGSGIAVTNGKRGWITPTVASDGRGFLVVWAYGRNGLNRDIFAARVSKDGKVLDDSPIVVSDARKTKAEPTVVWTGRHYLAAWEDYRNSPSHAGSLGEGELDANGDIYGTRISSAGKVLDPKGFRLAGGRRNELTPELTVSGNKVAMAWARDCYRAGRTCTHDAYAAPLARNGRRARRAIHLGTRKNHEILPALLATPDGYLAAWTDWNRRTRLRLRRIDSNWHTGPVHRLDEGDRYEYSPRLVWVGDHAILSWISASPCISCGGDVLALRVRSNGAPSDRRPKVIAGRGQAEWVSELESNGRGCALALYERE